MTMPSVVDIAYLVKQVCVSSFAFVAKSFKAIQETIAYRTIWLYVAVRWTFYCWTGLWGFGEVKQSPTIDSDCTDGQRTIEEHFRRIHEFGFVPGQIRYLGQFLYESWNDKRWKPKEKDYEADDEAEEDS